MKKTIVFSAALAAGIALVPFVTGGAAGTFSPRAEMRWARIRFPMRRELSGVRHLLQPPRRPRRRARTRRRLSVVQLSGQYESRAPMLRGLQVWPYSARLVVSGKGEILLAVRAAEGCLQGPPSDTVLSPTQTFTVTGGSGVYTGASGSGEVGPTRIGRLSSGHGYGTDVWKGTLVVPGFEFDLTRPKITGAVDKVVRAPSGATRVRVRYRLATTDNVDGALAVVPTAFGQPLQVGRRTVVRCSATDKSANTMRASFTVTVKRP